MKPTYCMQCGSDNKPVAAVGVDEDGEPACGAHVARPHVESAAPPPKCVRDPECSKSDRHRGRCNRGVSAGLPVKRKVIPLVRKTSITAGEVEKAFPDTESFVADSMVRVQLHYGEVALLYRGDPLMLLSHDGDRNFVMDLVKIIRGYGNGRSHPITKASPTSKTGQLVQVTVDESFVDDMLTMYEPQDKADILSREWNK